ncbi:carbohydrate binding family 9 domain-containing protein [bacterium]|nr:carbohydrate binding family 9 domain-containing protein [bacterium]
MKHTILISILLASGMLRSQKTDTTYQAIRISNPISIDGRLSEPVWETVPAITGFYQLNPDEGKPASQKTIVRIAYNNDALYVGARMHDSAPDSIVARLARRDQMANEDFFAFAVDSYHDHRSGFYFALSAGGTMTDGVCYNDDWTDDSWDAVWEGRVSIDGQGWTAEFRIPFSQLRFRRKKHYIWGINFRRDISRRNEQSFLVFTPKGSSGFVSRFPDLAGIEGISPSSNIEILPYVRTKTAYTHPDAQDPFHDRLEYSPDIGGDVKVALSNNLTLDMTVNPDFGQVEVDPAVVNLSDVETFYDEKRPFFIEGSSTYQFGYGGANNYWGFNWSNPQFFYSRRIGSAPRGEWPDNDYSDVPEGVHILGAAKITGKLADQWNVGMLHALTRRETGSFSLDHKTFRADIEPLTYFGLIRTQREINDACQGIGLISTVTARRFHNDALRADFNDNALTFGMDGWTFLDTSRTWVFAGWLGGSHVTGIPERMVELQRNSQHYFQRPDADYVSVDSSAEHLSGIAGRFYLNKQRGNIIVNSAVGFISPGFDVNDLGYFSRADWINAHFGIGYLWTRPGKVFRFADIIGALHQSTDFGGRNLWRGIFLLSEMQFVNYMSCSTSFFYHPETYNQYRTRGGPVTLNDPGFGVEHYFRSDDRQSWVLEFYTYNYHRSRKEWYRSFEMEMEWKPGSNMSIEAGPEIVFNRENAQWVDAFEDPFAAHTFETRYVFAEMKQTEIRANIRLNWTFTPRLSLQIYLQPLISHGDYTRFKELAKPGTYDFNTYSASVTIRSNGEYEIDPDAGGPAGSFAFDNPDFNYKSLRGNAVLRWEYLPGSTLYLVWTLNRWNDQLHEPFSFMHSARKLLETHSDYIFMLKATYWWSL